MATFIATQHFGTVSFIGAVLSREKGLASKDFSNGKLTFDGLVGECHGGRTRPSCERVSMLYKVGTTIANRRQLSILSTEELEEVRQSLKITNLDPQWLGGNIVLSGIGNFSALPPSSRLLFESGASVAIDVENGPCVYAAGEIASHMGTDAKSILGALKHKRGVVGSVEAEGAIAIGMRARLYIPNVRPF